MARILFAIVALGAVLVLATVGCGSSGGGGGGGGGTPPGNTLVWDQGSWDQNTWGP